MIRAVLAVAAVAACGDNQPAVGPPIAHADTLVVIAHFDDDMIFMQPELLHALESGSVTTVYVASGDPVHGDERAEHNFEAAMTAYGLAARSTHWDCGYVDAGGSPVHHCRLHDRPVSMIGLDLPDGGIPGDGAESLLHLVQGDVAALHIHGLVGGTANVASITDELGAIVTATQPAELHALDLAATHGYDHSSHLFSSAFAFWAAARVGYAGPVRWHRGYNVESEQPTLADADLAAVTPMLSYFEACYFGCGTCGSSCPALDPAHATWLRRQYSWTRDLTTHGVLARTDDPAACLTVTGGALGLGDCATAPVFLLDATGRLGTGGLCATAGDAAVTLAACDGSAAQRWWLDSDGALWSAVPPAPAADMAHDHVRCLDGATAPICGARLHPTWLLH
jgi:hypothetical protein